MNLYNEHRIQAFLVVNQMVSPQFLFLFSYLEIFFLFVVNLISGYFATVSTFCTTLNLVLCCIAFRYFGAPLQNFQNP
jgi:hypothetical protein